VTVRSDTGVDKRKKKNNNNKFTFNRQRYQPGCRREHYPGIAEQYWPESEKKKKFVFSDTVVRPRIGGRRTRNLPVKTYAAVVIVRGEKRWTSTRVFGPQ